MGWGTDEPTFCQVFTSQFIPGGTPDQWRWFSEKMRISTSAENAARYMRVVQEIDIRELAQQVRCPSLVIHSRDDARVPYEEGKLTAALIPGSEFVTLDSANHVVLEDEPAWPQLIGELRRFLEARPADGPGVDGGQREVRFASLSDRERQVVELLARGLGNDEIAGDLFLSPKTVRNHVSHIFAKIDVNSRAQAIVAAREAGFGRGQVGQMSRTAGAGACRK
jgi:DNA-binding NarL/FixJ family response regulator